MIPLFKIRYPKGIGQKIEDVFASGMITEGEISDEFERKFSKYSGNPYTLLVNSCTSALTLAYRMCDIGPGTEVISTPMTCMATNEPIMNAGAKIVWADIDPSTGNIDASSVSRLITDKTRAIVGVHWAGDPFDINELTFVAKSNGIPLIADAAHALGSMYEGKHVGAYCDYTVYSFQAIKHLTTVDGGAITSKSKLNNERLRLMRWFGLDRKYTGSKWEQDIVESGYKFHMNNVNAAIGLEQLNTIDDVISAHKKNGAIYDSYIKNNKKVKKLERSKHAESAYWIYTILVDNPDRFSAYMKENGVATDRVHIRNDSYSVFKDFRRSYELKGCDEFCSKMINIPVGWWLSNSDVEYIIDKVNRYA